MYEYVCVYIYIRNDNVLECVQRIITLKQFSATTRINKKAKTKNEIYLLVELSVVR